MNFPELILKFIDSAQWTYAKTMPEWTHEYIVRKNVPDDIFVGIVTHIRKFGYVGKFYNTDITYFEEAGMVYWTMGAPINETIIINRARVEDTYEYRLANGTLPKPKSSGIKAKIVQLTLNF